MEEGYFSITVSGRTAAGQILPTGFGEKYDDLSARAVRGYDKLLAETDFGKFDDKDNKIRIANEQLYKERGYFAELFCDKIENGPKGQVGNRLHVKYIIPGEEPQCVWAPKSGLWVPTNDGIFNPDTLIPFETLPFDQAKEALKRLEKHGIPKDYLSGFHMPNNYNNGYRIVGRHFFLGFVDDGRFSVDAYWQPGYSGYVAVGSCSTPIKPAFLMEKSAAREEIRA